MSVALAVVAGLALVLAQAMAVLVVPMPAWPVTAADVVLYGPWVGFGLSYAGTMIGSVAAFSLGRRFGWRLVRRLGKAAKYADWAGGTDGLWLVPLLALPVPAGGDVGCFMAGLSEIRLQRFVLLACVGRLPGTALAVLAVSGVATGSVTAVVVAVAGLLVLSLAARRWRVSRARGTGSEAPRSRQPSTLR